MPLAEYQSQSANDRQCAESSGNLFGSVEARTGMTGPNKTRILLFSLGTQEKFGINVSGISEVCRAMHIARAPNMPLGMGGIAPLRGRMIPVLALDKLLGLDGNAPNQRHAMIVAEHNRYIFGFLVHRVERIIHVDSDKVRPVEGMLSGDNNLVAAITKLADGKLVSLLGVAQILAAVFGKDLAGNVNPEWSGFSPGKGMYESENNKGPAWVRAPSGCAQSATGKACAELTEAGELF